MSTGLPCKRIALTTGEPSGIGPDLAVLLSQSSLNVEVIALADANLLKQRAELLNISCDITNFDPQSPASPNKAGCIKVLDIPCSETVIAGELNTANAPYVLALLDTAINLAENKTVDAVVTGPVQKSVINDYGLSFSGHTEYFADKTNTSKVVMMLATEDLRVALATTHLPLKDVANSISESLLQEVITILHNDLQQYFCKGKPRILVAGLNPHAGENGHLGREEIDIIEPTLQTLRNNGMDLQGPLPADTLFTPKYLDNADAVLAMYHDQGLPVLKFHGFGKAANITLGLPIIRTSVDHGTALDLAATGNIDCGSLITAINIAHQMASQHD